MNTEQNISSSSSTFAVMALEYVETASLKYPSRRLRRHSESKLRRLAKFMKKSGVITPLVVDKDNFVILGNARLAALKLLGVDTVPVIRVTHLDEPMIRALILADNQFTLNADWYEDALREELLYLAPLLPEIGLELIDLGFETPQLDLIIGDADANDEEELGPDPAVPPVVQPGQLWLLGQHKLFCGDAREEISYISLMGTERAVMIFGDLPYNVPIDGHVCGNGAHQHKEFVMGAGEMSPEQFISFMKEIFVLLRRFSKEGSVHMQCMDWRHSLEILTAAQQAGYDYLNMACWVKHAGGMGSLYRSQHELVHIFKSGAGSHINNVMLGKFGRIFSGMRHFEAFFDEEGEYVAGKSTAIATDIKIDPYFLLGLLNSKIIRFFFKEAYGALGMDGGINFSPSNICKIPVPSDKEKNANEIGVLSRGILKSSDEIGAQNLKNKIDHLVYQLYGLTPEEIAIVEEAVQ